MRWTLIVSLVVLAACGETSGIVSIPSSDSASSPAEPGLAVVTDDGGLSDSRAWSSASSSGAIDAASASSSSQGSDTASTSTAGSSATATDGSISSSSSSSSGAASSASSSAAAPGGSSATLAGHESWAWLYTNYSASLAAITSNVGSFTHISPAFYTINYPYASGVAYYSNCGGGSSCTDPGTNDFDGLTTRQLATDINGLGLATVPLIYGGAANSGVDIGVQNILNDTNGAQASFIGSMVQEAVANGYAGYNLDWEVGSGVGASYASSFVTFVDAFKAALAVHGMSLSADAVVSNINGSWCSGNDGYLDFGLLSTSSIDRIIIEDYTNSLGTTYNSCEPVVLASAQPVECPIDSAGSNVNFTGVLNYMCSNLPANMVVIGVESYSAATNGFAGAAISTMQSYGMDKVAVWPQDEGSYPFLSSNDMVAPVSDWYALLAGFLQG